MCLILDLTKANLRITELEKQVAPLVFPPPPTSTVTINANEVFNLLLPYGINITGGSSDYLYKLFTKGEANRFVKWYKINAPIKPSEYSPDNRDCDDYGWFMRTWALLWSKSEYLFGYIEAEGIDPVYDFPNHGFCFLIIDDLTVCFADALCVAAPDDEIMLAYIVKCNMAKC